MIGELAAQDAAIIIGACSTAFVALLSVVLKFMVDIRKTTNAVNNAVNNRPPSEPTIRSLVEQIDQRIDDLRAISRNWHTANVHRIDRLADAIGGVNRRLDKLEKQKGPNGSESDT